MKKNNQASKYLASNKWCYDYNETVQAKLEDYEKKN
jgi:hypothetical protein